MATDVVIARGDNWCGLYINRKLEYESHNISAEGALRCLVGHTIATFVTGEVNDEWLDENGTMPKDIRDIEWYHAPPKWAIGG